VNVRLCWIGRSKLKQEAGSDRLGWCQATQQRINQQAIATESFTARDRAAIEGERLSVAGEAAEPREGFRWVPQQWQLVTNDVR